MLTVLTHAETRRRDRTGRQDSNLGMAESKSTCSAFDFKDHSEKSTKFDPFPINRLDADSECESALPMPYGAPYYIGPTIVPTSLVREVRPVLGRELEVRHGCPAHAT